MKRKLSDRMQKIASLAAGAEVVADIGTDHGYIPIWLLQNNACSRVIFSDVVPGPLERAEENAKKIIGEDFQADLRLGSGIKTLENGEADTVIIAGMGGLLIRDILSADLQKTSLIHRLILQPRNNAAALRLWLSEALPEFCIIEEAVVPEGDKFSEILHVINTALLPLNIYQQKQIAKAEQLQKKWNLPDFFAMEIPPLLLLCRNQATEAYLKKRALILEDIICRIRKSGNGNEAIQQKKRLEEQRSILKRMTEAYYETGKNI